MLRVIFGSDFWLCFVLEVEFYRFNFLVTATRFVSCIVQGTDFGLGIPLKFHLGDL